jgi:UDP-glucose 4-epimerase
VIEHFIDAMSKNEPIKIYGDGTAIRDYVHVDDVVDANLLAMTYPHSTQKRIFNVCTGKGTSVTEVAQLICGKDYPIEWLPSRSEAKFSIGSTKMADMELGFKSKRSIQELSAAHK